jgi:hypothetical protein
MGAGFTRAEIDRLTLPQIELFSAAAGRKRKRDAAEALLLQALAAGQNEKAINKKLKELS